MDAPLLDAVRAWIRADPDEDDRAELQQLLDQQDEPELTDRFGGPLRFGTAGIRGPMRAGPNGINTSTVARTAAGLAAFLGPSADVVVAFDGRHRSRDLAGTCAEVLAGAGCPVALVDAAVPTPLLAFAVRYRAAAAGVMVTASHNPAADNGVKVYLGGSAGNSGNSGNGAQLAPPTDEEIEQAIAAVGAVGELPRRAPCPLFAAELARTYLDVVVGPQRPGRELRIAYTPLHGVGLELMTSALVRAGFREPVVVPEQATPDPDFPTVPFPNPEAAGALDRLLELVRSSGADIGIASDPDADRCAVVVGDRALSGDELGCLLGDALLRRRPGPVATSIVSSSLLPAIAAHAGVPCHVTLTGFKWLMRAGPDLVFAYEEALGYAVRPDVVRDKDGISAAVLVAELADELRASGRTLVDRLDELAVEFGLHLTRGVTVRLPSGKEAARRVAALHEEVPDQLGGLVVRSVEPLRSDAVTLPRDGGVLLRLDGGRVLVRPSGTEPTVKAYLELIRPVRGPVAEVRRTATAELDRLALDVYALLTGGLFH